MQISLTVNGNAVSADVDARTLLVSLRKRVDLLVVIAEEIDELLDDEPKASTQPAPTPEPATTEVPVGEDITEPTKEIPSETLSPVQPSVATEPAEAKKPTA